MAEPSTPTQTDSITRYVVAMCVLTMAGLLGVRMVYRPLQLNPSPLSDEAIELELRRWLQTPSRRSAVEVWIDREADPAKIQNPHLPHTNQWRLKPSEPLHRLGVRRMVFWRYDPKALWVVTAGDDGAPGHVGVDDGFNGQVDDASEFGATGSDDVFMVLPPGALDDMASGVEIPHIVLSSGGHVLCDPRDHRVARIHLIGEASERMIDRLQTSGVDAAQ